MIVEPARVRFGTIPPGRRVTAQIQVRNPGEAALRVDRFDASCPCVRLTPPQCVVDPKGSVEFAVEYDPAPEPEFRGALAVSVSGLAPEGRELFRLTVHVAVEDTATD